MPHNSYRQLVLFSVVLCMTLVSGRPASAMTREVEWPDTLAAKTARAYIELINQGDAQAYRNWENEHRTAESLATFNMDERVSMWSRMCQMWGTLNVDSIVESSPYKITILLQDTNSKRWRTFTFELESDAPHKMTTMFMERAMDPAQASLSWDQFDDIADLLTQVRKDTGIPAIAVALVKDGKIVDQAAVGVREVGKDDQVKIDDRFHWGSVTKSVTGSIIGHLIEQGVLNWDTTIGETLSESEPRSEYLDVTIEQLMGHAGGIESYTRLQPGMFDAHMDEPTPVAQRASFVREVLQKDPLGTPGKTMHYSNAGITVAAHIAEKQSGKPWEEMVHEYVYAPLGMSTSGLGWPRDISTDQPSGHMQEGKTYAPFDFLRNHPMNPAGNVHSSVGDFALYAIGHLNGLAGKDGFLKAATIQRMHTPLPEVTGREGYAFGWGLRDYKGQTMHWHNGSAGTFYAEIRLFPKQNAGIIIMVNAGGTNQIGVKIADAIYDKYIVGGDSD
ncbi:MAG: serine hydrolase [Planctomycetota bacterium]|nr:serine hydrolase [Planctomycetota bacterium]